MKKTQKIIAMLLSLMLVFALPACKTQKTSGGKAKGSGKVVYPLTIVDSYERSITIDKEPKRIISIAPNITEIIYALGKGDKLVGRTEYCDYPEQVSSVQSIGTLKEPNVEKIVELKPDIVIASTHFSKDVVTKLEQLNIKVVVIYGQETFDGVYENIDKVGEVLNARDKAGEVISGMKTKVQAVLDKVKDAGKPKLYYVVGYGEYGDFTAGKGTFIAQLIEMAGAVNTANDVEGWNYSLEKIVENNPEIIVCSKYFDTKAGIMAANGYKELEAVRTGKLFEIDNNLLDRQGPRLAEGLEELAKIVHPDLFK